MNRSHWRRAIWRQTLGPLLSLATGAALLSFARHGIQVPTPGAIMLATVLLSSCLGGGVAGVVSGVIGIACGYVLLTDPTLTFTPGNEFRLQLLVAVSLALPLLVSYLRRRTARHLEVERTMRERAETANRELLTLRAELERHAQELERLATTDDLTGLCNRRHFLALAEAERRRHMREQRPLAVLIFDIDHFKSVNDRFGHDTGDAVIRHVADVCRGEISGTEIVARVGGEEFVMLLPGASGKQAMARAEAMRQQIETTAFEVDGARMKVTVSIGVSDTAAPMDSIGDLMKRADQALYQAKRDGRNCVRYARPTPRPDTAAAATAAAA